jgi:hypothetical protein
MRQTVIIVGAILFAGLIIAGSILLAKQPAAADTTDRERQTATVENVMRLAICVEQYIMDNPAIGSPKIGDRNIADLQALLMAAGKSAEQAPIMDGWDRPFHYEFAAAPGGKDYTLTSYGADGAPGPAPAVKGLVRKFEEDIIFRDGRFIQRPEGAKVSPR